MIYGILHTIDDNGYIFTIKNTIDNHFWLFPQLGSKDRLMIRYRYKHSSQRMLRDRFGNRDILGYRCKLGYKVYYTTAEIYAPEGKSLHKIEVISKVEYETLQEFCIPSVAVYERQRKAWLSGTASNSYDYHGYKVSLNNPAPTLTV